MEFLQAARFVIYALVLPPYAWLLVAYAVSFWRTRRRDRLEAVLQWLLFSLVAMPDGMRARSVDRGSTWGIILSVTIFVMYGFLGYIVVYRYWLNRVPVAGYERSRDLLLLRRSAPLIQPTYDAERGLYMPRALTPAEEPITLASFGKTLLILPKAAAIAFVITVIFFALTKLLFGFGPFF